MRYSPDDIQRARQDILPLKGRERKAKIHEYMDRTGASQGTIYRWIATPGDNGSRKVRSDAGIARNPIPQEALDKMIGLTLLDWPAEMVVETALVNGWLKHPIHPQTYNAILLRNGLSRKALTAPTNMQGKSLRTRLLNQPHRRFWAAYVNLIQQVDTTELKPYFFAPETGEIAFEPDKGPNRENNGYPRVHLFALIDDHSRCMYAELRRRRDTENWASFLHNAWSVRDEDENPFCGMPETLYGDEDGATKGRFRDLMDELGVHYEDHEPGNSAAKGKVEAGAIKFLKLAITRILRLHLSQGKTLPLSEANALLAKIVDKKNNTVHRTTGQIPTEAWSVGQKNPIREVPPWDEIRPYLYISREVLVHDDLSIWLDKVNVQLPRKAPFIDLYGKKVWIRFDRDKSRRTEIQVQVDRVWHTVPATQVTPDESGQFRSLPVTEREKQIERSYATDLSDLDIDGIYQTPERARTIVAIPPKPSPPAPVFIPRRQAAIALSRHGYTREEIAEICADDEIEKSIIDEKISTPKRRAL